MTDDHDDLIDYTRVKQNAAGEFYVLGYGGNHEIVVTSEGYENESHAREVAAELGPIKEDDEG